MVANNNKLLQLFKIQTSQKMNDNLRGNTYNSSQKPNLANKKGTQNIDKEKAHNSAEKWARTTETGS